MRRYGLIAGVALGALSLACEKSTARETHGPSGGPSSGGACEGCHADSVRGWAESMHHASFSSPDFQASYAEEPLPFCKDCHAPATRRSGGVRARDGGGADEQAAEALGVDCESCHPGAAPHADARSHGGARRAGTAPCATCHEFASPGATTLLQSTETEHAASAHRDTPCVSCHMKRLGSQGRDHRFAVSRAPDFLRGALSLGGAEVGADEVSFTLRARDVGHAFPTGDIFRQLLVEATLEADDGRILAVVERSLRRDWDAHRRAYRSTQASEEADTRLFDAPRRLSVPLVAGATRLVVRVRYQRGFEARGNALALFSSTPLAEASFPLSAARR